MDAAEQKRPQIAGYRAPAVVSQQYFNPTADPKKCTFGPRPCQWYTLRGDGDGMYMIFMGYHASSLLREQRRSTLIFRFSQSMHGP